MISDKLKKYKLAYNKFLKECKNSKSKKCKKLSKSLKRSVKRLSKSRRSRKSKRKSVKRRRSRRHDGAWEYRLPVNSVSVQVAGLPFQKYQGGYATLNCENNFTLNDLNNIPCVIQGANINLNQQP